MNESTKTEALGAKEARESVARREHGVVRVIDIRDTEEFGEGHIAGAINVEDGTADSVRAAIDEADEADRWLLVCGDGDRSRELASELAGGDAEVVYLEGGMDAWEGDKLPVQPPPPSEFQGPKKKTLY